MMVATGCKEKERTEPAKHSTKSKESTVTLASPKAPAVFPVLVAAEQQDAQLHIDVKTWDTLEQFLAQVQEEEAQFFAAPLNVGANMYTKGIPLQLIHVNTWGSMYLASIDSEVRNLRDLEGETIYLPGPGGPPSVLTEFLINKEQLDGKIQLAYGAIPDIMQQLANGTIKHAVLPEPALSGLRVKLQRQLHEVVDYQSMWKSTFGEDLPSTGIFVHKEWAEKHPKEIADFQELYSKGVEDIHQQPQKVLKPAADLLSMPEPVISQSMDKIILGFKDATTARQEVERYFDVLLQIAPEAVGGKQPDDDFYYDL
ncbi:ABC transporter substrate-binding protein [Bacillus sp. Hm123]|uniref:ABC transporter substrate-binding protein n=1 Tax=Bacillus sp. Hm123 TaxID=3450745 RepID=UPI003F444F19